MADVQKTRAPKPKRGVPIEDPDVWTIRHYDGDLVEFARLEFGAYKCTFGAYACLHIGSIVVHQETQECVELYVPRAHISLFRDKRDVNEETIETWNKRGQEFLMKKRISQHRWGVNTTTKMSYAYWSSTPLYAMWNINIRDYMFHDFAHALISSVIKQRPGVHRFKWCHLSIQVLPGSRPGPEGMNPLTSTCSGNDPPSPSSSSTSTIEHEVTGYSPIRSTSTECMPKQTPNDEEAREITEAWSTAPLNLATTLFNLNEMD